MEARNRVASRWREVAIVYASFGDYVVYALDGERLITAHIDDRYGERGLAELVCDYCGST